ncbi:Ribosomal protein S6 kinase alpha-5 [Phytophthora boehmeriae]|uniref:Ribosomal protein S6 kinase alpha-5 n=1 Tax=Phytophthora boehmeriae TaxID=109152 RepID=A0A8T1XFZ4_9STRA|nr:Ribosomal protein S6 kinase alpha-5 [Phytophthora boehmeriae]
MHNNLHSPQVVQSATHSRRGSIGLASGASAEDSMVFVDNLIRGVQQRLRTELGFREVVVATGEEAEDLDSGRARTLLTGSILNDPDHDSPTETQPWEATAASKRALLYPNGRKGSDASACSDCAKGTVYVSDGYENKQRLLVIVPYREAGIWSRSICMNQFDSGSDSGSMLSYLKKALAENYGVMIMNPAAQSCHPRAHVENAWDQLIAPLLSEVFIVAFSRGAQMVLHLLNYDNGQGVMQDRVKALALVEPSHYVSDSDTYFARRVLARRAVAWILNSEIDVGEKIPQGHTRHGCVCVSAGTVPSNVLGSSGAYALEMVKSSVFGSFAARCGEAANITVNANKINACGICHRKLSMLNRRIPCSWCEVKYCSRCCEDKFVPAFGSWRVCSLCQSLPCLIDPRRKNRSAKNHTSPSNAAAQERCSVFIRPTADDDDPVCLGDFEIVKLGLDWERVERKEAIFQGQFELMEKHAKEYRTEDIFETYMNTVEVPIDTPASVKSSNDELFNDFAFNYMDGPDDTEQRDVPEPDEEGEGGSPLSPISPDTTPLKLPRALVSKEDRMLDTFLSTNGSHFDLTLLRPNQATDFGVSACSSLSSEGTDSDVTAVPVDQIEEDMLKTTDGKKVASVDKLSSPTTQPVSPSSNAGTDVDSSTPELTKTGSNSTDATETEADAAKAT